MQRRRINASAGLLAQERHHPTGISHESSRSFHFAQQQRITSNFPAMSRHSPALPLPNLRAKSPSTALGASSPASAAPTIPSPNARPISGRSSKGSPSAALARSPNWKTVCVPKDATLSLSSSPLGQWSPTSLQRDDAAAVLPLLNKRQLVHTQELRQQQQQQQQRALHQRRGADQTSPPPGSPSSTSPNRNRPQSSPANLRYFHP